MQSQSQNQGPSIFSSFRALRLFKIFRLFKIGDLRILLDSIQFTVSTIGDYVILLLLCIYVFSLLGMSFFAGQLKYDGDDRVDQLNGTSPRSNFDSLGLAVLTIFQSLLTDGWNEILYNCMRSVSVLAAFYYIFVMVFGNIIMLNLFLAILLGNFDKARSFGQKKMVFQAIKEFIDQGKSLNEALDIILGDMSMYVKTKVLKWDRNEVIKVHHVGDSPIAIKLLEEGAKFFVQKESQNSQQSNLRSVENQADIQNAPSDQEISVTLNNKNQSTTDNKMQIQKQQIDEQKQKLDIKTNTKYPKTKISIKQHILNPKILRLKEFNRQYHLKSFDGLKAILYKSDLTAFDTHCQNEHQPVGIDQQLNEQIENQTQYQEVNSIMKQGQQNIGNQEQNYIIQLNLGKLQNKIEDDINFLPKYSESNQSLFGPNTNQFEDGLSRKTYNQDKSSFQQYKSQICNEKNQIQQNTERIDHKIFVGTNIYLQNFDHLNKQERDAYYCSIGKKPQYIETDILQSINEREHEVVFSYKQRIKNHLNSRSLFIFHKNNILRKFCLILAEPPAVLNQIEKSQNQQQSEQDENTSNEPKPYDNNQDQLQKSNCYARIKSFFQLPNKSFDNTILIFIVLSSILLAIDDPLGDPNGQSQKIINWINVIFTILFSIEAFVKITAKGLLYNSIPPVEAYIKSAWNMLDLFVVIAALVDLFFQVAGVSSSSLSGLKALRALRALRPLRVISQNEGMKLVVNALLASIPSMTNVMLVCSVVILIFAIMGVNFFQGAFFSCIQNQDTKIKLDLSQIFNHTDCEKQGGLWQNRDQNFDNVLNAMSTLFQMITTEGWEQVMWDGEDSVGIDQQPQQYASAWLALYFVTFMIVGSQFIINLFVGVVIDNFNTIKEKEELGNMFVTEQQRSWIEIQKVCQQKTLKIKVNEPKGCQLPFFRLANNKIFEYTITTVIFMNTGIMALKHYRMPELLVKFSDNSNYFFALAFNFEMIIKLIGLGRIYFLYTWNIFDMTIVVMTDLGILLDILSTGGSFSSTATVIRAFRIMRIFKLIRSSIHIRLILDTLFNILPQITNVMSLIVLLYFIYAALGINLFSGIMLQDYLNTKFNFQSFPNAMIVLIRFSTGEDWNTIMYQLAGASVYNGVRCVVSHIFFQCLFLIIIQANQTYNDIVSHGALGCGTSLAIPYCISFTIIVTMLIMNLTVAAVIDGLDTSKKQNMGIIQGDDIDILINLWQDYDPLATGWITLNDLIFLLYELPRPLGSTSGNYRIDGRKVTDPDSKQNQGLKQQDRYMLHTEKGIIMQKVDSLQLLRNLNIIVHKHPIKQIHFVNVVKSLIKRVFIEKKVDYKLSEGLDKKMKIQWNKQHYCNEELKGKNTAREAQAASIITKWAKSILNREKIFGRNIKTDQRRFQNKNNNQNQSQHIKKGENQNNLKDQAKAIMNILYQVPDEDDIQEYDEENIQFDNNINYKWKDKGGWKILKDGIDNDKNENKKSSKNLSQLQEISIDSNTKLIKQYEQQLFGPKTQSYFQNYENEKKTSFI